MLRRTLNLGILAHVDAGKTTLTERLLYAAGVIDEIGSVDDGSTQTDSLALERQRGITIKSAVVSFALDDVAVNLIDTPGHPDFIAEVERVLSVLDGVVLVVSAVEGVQAQTRVLMRALQRLRIPTLLFVNKVDRRGADCARVLREIAEKLTPGAIAMGAVEGEGTPTPVCTAFGEGDAGFASRLVDLLAEQDDALLAAFVDDEASVSPERLRSSLAGQTKRAHVHPVFCGSAITGAGVDALTAGITELLPAAAADAEEALSATVFKVERGKGGEKVAYARVFAGTIRVRDRVPFRRDGAGQDGAKVTAVSVFDGGSAPRGGPVAAGQIGTLRGLADIQIGDTIGERPARPTAAHAFARPTLESVVAPRRSEDQAALFVALTQLAEQDPLIGVRRDDRRHELSVSLYGEVQKEVIQATLAADFAIDAEFRETTPICIERPVGSGAALDVLGKAPNPFLATVGLRLEPAPVGSGLTFGLDVDVGSVPLYVYKSVGAFAGAVEDAVRETLRQGLFGWEVTDCTVTLTASGYAAPSTTAGDFRKLTPLVVMAALKEAGTQVCEPIQRFQLDGPAEAFPATLRVLAQLRAEPRASTITDSSFALEGEIAAARTHLLQQQLGGATRGEGVLQFAFARYEPVTGAMPIRPRSDFNPLDREDYLLHLARRVGP